MKIEEAIDGAPEMGSVADVVGIALGHIPAIEQVERREDVAGYNAARPSQSKYKDLAGREKMINLQSIR